MLNRQFLVILISAPASAFSAVSLTARTKSDCRVLLSIIIRNVNSSYKEPPDNTGPCSEMFIKNATDREREDKPVFDTSVWGAVGPTGTSSEISDHVFSPSTFKY